MSCWLLMWIYNYSHYMRRANTLSHSITENEPRASFLISYCLHVSHSFFPMHVTQWDFHQPVPPSLSHCLVSSLSPRCQVQWERLCCWMPSDTFQNNDNKLEARPSAVYCRHTPLTVAHTKWPKTKQTHTHTHRRVGRRVESSNITRDISENKH